jgi:hypothetical protein
MFDGSRDAVARYSDSTGLKAIKRNFARCGWTSNQRLDRGRMASPSATGFGSKSRTEFPIPGPAL